MTTTELIAKLQAKIDELKNMPPGITEALDLIAQDSKEKYASIRQEFTTYGGSLDIEWATYADDKSHKAPSLAGLIALIRNAKATSKAQAEVAAQLASEDAKRLRMEEAALQIGPADSYGNITVRPWTEADEAAAELRGGP